MKEFDQDLAVEAARVHTINKLAEKLVSQGHAGSADITNRQQALNERWNRLQDRASERRQQLAEACEMHAFDRDCKDVSDLINEKVSCPLLFDLCQIYITRENKLFEQRWTGRLGDQEGIGFHIKLSNWKKKLQVH